jgi:hypothetical protein
VSLIVSEESGVISSANGGRMTRYLDEEQLRENSLRADPAAPAAATVGL